MQDMPVCPGSRYRPEPDAVNPQAANRLHCPKRLCKLHTTCYRTAWSRLYANIDHSALGTAYTDQAAEQKERPGATRTDGERDNTDINTVCTIMLDQRDRPCPRYLRYNSISPISGPCKSAYTVAKVTRAQWFRCITTPLTDKPPGLERFQTIMCCGCQSL